MINGTVELYNALASDRSLNCRLDVRLKDGTEFEIDDDTIMANGISIDDSTSESGELSVGSAIMNTANITLDNYDDSLTKIDFRGAKVVVNIAVVLEDNRTEWIQKGVFLVEDQYDVGVTVVLECVDDMIRFDTPFSRINIHYPVQLNVLATAICNACGIHLATPSLPIGTTYIPSIRDADKLTCRDVISFIAQMNGTYARMSRFGALEFKWYDYTSFDTEDDLYGGYFDASDPYASGDDIDGGDFTFSETTHYNGGDFSTYNKYHVINDTMSSTIGNQKITVSGVGVDYEVEQSNGGEVDLVAKSITNGYEDYTIVISDNPLITTDTLANTVLNVLSNALIGMYFYTCSVSTTCNPLIEGGDIAYVLNTHGRSVPILVTSTSFTMDSTTTVDCEAVTPSENASTSYGAISKLKESTKQLIAYERTARETAMAHVDDMLANSSGMYPSDETLPNGSKVYYMHDKPTRAESTIIWRIVAQGMSISIDGGNTYPTSITADGQAILDRIYAIGIDAKYITVNDTFRVGNDFIVNNRGALTTKTGTIGQFVFDSRGFISNTMQLLDTPTEPLIWLRSQDKTQHANYQGNLSAVRTFNPANNVRTETIMDSRTNWTQGFGIRSERLENVDSLAGDVVSEFKLDQNVFQIWNSEDYKFYSINIHGFHFVISSDGLQVSDGLGNNFSTQSDGFAFNGANGGGILNVESGIYINNSNGVYVNGETIGSIGGGATISSLQEEVANLWSEIAYIKQMTGTP